MVYCIKQLPKLEIICGRHAAPRLYSTVHYVRPTNIRLSMAMPTKLWHSINDTSTTVPKRTTTIVGARHSEHVFVDDYSRR